MFSLAHLLNYHFKCLEIIETLRKYGGRQLFNMNFASQNSFLIPPYGQIVQPHLLPICIPVTENCGDENKISNFRLVYCLYSALQRKNV